MPYSSRKKRLEYGKAYYRKNIFTIKIKDSARKKIYYKNNRDYFIKTYKEWRKNNVQRSRDLSYVGYRRNIGYHIKYREEHKEERRAYCRKHKDKYNLNRRLKYAKNRKAYCLREKINKKYHIWFNIKNIISDYSYFERYYAHGIQ